jgi:DNA-binding SARP family transcriptional activator
VPAAASRQSPSGGSALRLSLLGGFDLTLGPDRLAPCTSVQRMLVYLAVRGRGRPVQRKAVAQELWSQVPSDRAASSLRSALWRLPRPDGRELVRTTTSTLSLAPEVRVDLWAGQDRARAISAGAEPPAERDGDPAADLTSDLLPDWDEEWLLVEQESYRQTRLHALEDLCDRLRQGGRYLEALQAGLAAVQCEPLRESAHRRVVEVHLAEGNPSEALREYSSFRRLLADELGLPPSPAIRRLVLHLLGRPLDGRAAPPR